MEKRAQQEEELFTRVPLTKQERKREKYLKKSKNGYGKCLECLPDISKVLKRIKCMITFLFKYLSFLT